MKRLRLRGRTAAVLGVAGVAILCPVFAPSAVAQTYLADLCWNVTVTERKPGPVPPETFPLRTGLTYVGGLHFSVQGTFTESGAVGIVNGAGELVGTDLVISMAYSHGQRAALPIAGAFELQVNAQTWTGTWFAINTFFNKTTRAFDHDFGGGTVELAACP